MITTLEALDEDSLVRILTEPKDSIVKQYQALFAMDQVELTFTDDALRAIAKRALERKPEPAVCGALWKSCCKT